MKFFALRSFRCMLVLVCSLAPLATHAVTTPIQPAPGNEPDLIEPDGILDQLFGLQNLTRIDDSADALWEARGAVSVQTLAKWAGFNHEFGFIAADGVFTPLFDVASWGHPDGEFGINDSGPRFRFGLDPSGAPLWSSRSDDNADSLDHMVTWQIRSDSHEDLHGAFVIAWEDLYGGGDRDFNDLVLLVKGDVALAAVPIPAALWLFGSGLLGLLAATRRRRTA